MPTTELIIGAMALAALSLEGAWLWLGSHAKNLPSGIVESIGRIKAERVDIASKFRAGLWVVWPHLLAVVGIGAVFFSFALQRFRATMSAVR